MSTAHHFLERRTVVEIDASSHLTQVTHCGGGTWTREGNECSAYHWKVLGTAGDHRQFAAHLRAPVESLLSPAPQEAMPSSDVLTWIAQLQRQSPTETLRCRAVSRRIVCAVGEQIFQDEQAYVLVELKAQAAEGSLRVQAQRELFYPAWPSPLSLDNRWSTELGHLSARAHQKLRAVNAPRDAVPVVIPPGADAAVLFHELCGHPLEADVVARRCSYLGARMGQRVAPEYVSVVDDPTAQDAGLHYVRDDEGQAAARVELLSRGVVGGTLNNDEEARQNQGRSNGHGRRTDFRRQSLPRMAHTALLPGAGTLEELMAPVSQGLLIHFMTPRHVDLLRGDFSFYIDEAQLIENGRATNFVGPALLRGNGLAVLRGIEAVGGDSTTFFGFKGCGKLDHGPLPVSFGNPSVRFSPIEVSPWI